MKRFLLISALLLELHFSLVQTSAQSSQGGSGQQSSDAQKTDRTTQTVPRRAGSPFGGGSINAEYARLQFLKMSDKIYRKPTKEELQNITPEAEDLRKYQSFLKKENSGLIRLMPDLGCSADERNVLNVSETCQKYSMPGGGSGFSFRKGHYWLWRLADVVFKDDTFYSISKYQQGIFINLGDVDLEKVSLQTKSVEFLMTYQPPQDAKEAQKNAISLKKGVALGKNKYSSFVSAKVNNTYVLRSIAYRGKLRRSFQGFIYNELDFDERKDVVVAFRVIRKSPDGSVTLLWKEMSRQKAPKLEFNAPIEKMEIKPQSFVAQDVPK